MMNLVLVKIRPLFLCLLENQEVFGFVIEEYTKLILHHGDLLIMQGGLQHKYVHKVPIEKERQNPGINLTFRKIADY